VSALGHFPFGQAVRPLAQVDRGAKEIFVLGVYASAVHARWLDDRGKELAKALAVASEPYIFWRGDHAEDELRRVVMPPGAGMLLPAADIYNGPSGVAVDDLLLAPLGRTRADAWLADLVPHSCANPRQLAAIDRVYIPRSQNWHLPLPSVSTVPRQLASQARQDEIAAEFLESKAEIMMLLGDEPIRWFLKRWDTSRRRLADFGNDEHSYGRLHEATIAGRRARVLPLAHPRQVAQLGRSSRHWYDLHKQWTTHHARELLS
jgi:hypothetical protein